MNKMTNAEKKWKLIKKYPFDNCPEIGAIVEAGGDGNIWFYGLKINPTNYPEYWQPIVEKTYEITGFYNPDDFTFDKPSVWREVEDGLWQEHVRNIMSGVCVAKEFLTSMYGLDIYSVKRLSDGQEFCIGDEFSSGEWIVRFYLDGENVIAELVRGNFTYYSTYYTNIKNLDTPIKEVKGFPVFLTTGYSYKPFTFIPQRWDVDKDNDDIKYFKTEEEAKDFIVKHKPCLSIQEVFNQYEKVSGVYFNGFVWADLHRALTDIVKSKIKK